jgi:hypothetical protein
MKRPATAMNEPVEAAAAVTAPPPPPPQEALVVVIQLLTQIYVGETDYARREHVIAMVRWLEDFLES